jgi:hypothetical protein
MVRSSASPASPESHRAPRSGARRWGLLLLGGVMLVGASGCRSVEPTGPPGDGLYLGAIAGAWWENFDMPTAFAVDQSAQFGARVGTRLLDRRAALELSLEHLVPVDLEVEDPSVVVGEVSGDLLMAHWKGYLVDAPLQGYWLVGAGVIDGEVTEDVGGGLASAGREFTWRVGAGVEIHTGPEWSTQLEGTWTQPGGELDAFGYYSIVVGILRRF